ncbi:MAG: hypothetical protein RL562_3055 [Planctomycetota bacterium]
MRTDPRPRPRATELIQAALLALVCALAFLGPGILPTRSVVPFVPERYEPLRTEALQTGSVTPAELQSGSPEFGDKYNQSLAWDRIQQDRLRGGSIPLWTRDIAGGAPFVPQMAQVYQPWNLLLLLPIPSVGIYGLWWTLHLLAYGVGAYWFLRRLGCRHPAALLGLVFACLGLWTQARIHHNVILSAALPLWPLLSLVHGAFRGAGTGLGSIALIGLLFGVTWSGGFAPVSLQTCLLAGALGAAFAARDRQARPLLPLAAGAGLGVLLALPQMGPTLLAARDSARDPATPEILRALGLSFEHLRTLLWPDLLHWPVPGIGSGGSPSPSWFALEHLPAQKARAFNFPETAFAIGVPGALLALLGALERRPRALFFAGVAAVSFALATATTPWLQVADVAGLSRVGDLRRFLFLTATALTVLAALGADRLLSRERVPLLTLGAAAVAAVSGWNWIELLATVGDLDAFEALYADRMAGPITLPDGTVVDVSPEQARAAMRGRPGEAAANLSHEIVTYGRTLAVALAALLASLFTKGTPRVLVLAACGGMELLFAGSGTRLAIPNERLSKLPLLLRPVAEATRAADAAAQPRPRLFRLEQPGVRAQTSVLFPPNLGAFHGLEDLSAYNPLPKRRMEELFAAIEPAVDQTPREILGGIFPPIVLGGAGVFAMTRPETLAHPVLDLLGCRFVLSAVPAPSGMDGIFDRVLGAVGGRFHMIERTTVMPRATFVDRADVVTDPAERLARLGDPTHPIRSVVLLEDGKAPIASGDGKADGDVVVVRHADEEVILRITCRENGYVRLADPWDAGWTAEVDGQPTVIHRADHYVRAVHVEAGEHVIRFAYDGTSARIWQALGLLGLGIAAVLGVLARVRRVLA